MFSFLKRKDKLKEPILESQKPSSWFETSLKDLRRAEELLDKDADIAAHLAWQAARKALKALEKKANRRLSLSSLEKLFLSFPEGQRAPQAVKDAVKFLDLFRSLASHEDIFRETTLGLGALTKEDAHRVINATKVLINHLEHSLK